MERFAIKIDKNLRANLYKICRLCGIDNPDKVKVLDDETIVSLEDGEPELWKKVLDCIGLLITKDDKMPQFMCTLCLDKINDFFEFREMCYATDSQTRKLLGIKEEPKLKKSLRASTSSVDFKTEDQDIKQPVVSAQRAGRKRRNADMEICNTSVEIKPDISDDVKPANSNTIASALKKKRLKLDNTEVDIKPGSPSKHGLSKKRMKIESTTKEKKDMKPAKIAKLVKKQLKVEGSALIVQDELNPLPLQIQRKKNALELLKQRKLAKKGAVVKVEKIRKSSIESKIKEEAPVPAPAPTPPKVKLKDKCAICCEGFLNKALLDKHIKNTHIPTVVRYHCVQCNETLKKNMEIKNHNLWHKLSKTPFQCGNCSESSCSIYTYSKHIRDCGQVAYLDAHIPDWHCPECGGVFETTYLFNIHSCVSNTLVCPGCDRSLKWKEDYFKHIPTCSSAVHRIPSYMSPNIQVKNEAEHPSSPIPHHHTHSLPSTASTAVQPTPATRITPPLMDSNQCVVIPGNVNLVEEASSPSSKSKKSKRITKKDLKRFDKLLKSTMTTLVSIKQEPTQGDGIGDGEQSSSSDVRFASESQPGSPAFGDDDFQNDRDDDSDDEQTSTQPVGAIKQEIIDEGYRDLYNNIEVNIKRELVPIQNRNTEVATPKKKGDDASEIVTPKPVLKLKITKEHGTLNSILMDSPKSEKKKKKKKRKEEKLKAAEREEAYVVQEMATDAPHIADATDCVENEPTMPLPEIICIKQEMITETEEEVEKQSSVQSSHSTPSIVAATCGSLQISCVSEGVHFNGAEEDDADAAEETEESIQKELTNEQENYVLKAPTIGNEPQEEEDIKPRLEDLIPMMQIASISSGEDLFKKQIKAPPKRKRHQMAVSLAPSTSTPQIVSVSSGSEVVDYQPEVGNTDNNENIFDYAQVNIKEELIDTTFYEQDCEMPQDEEEDENYIKQRENTFAEKQAEENAYIANLDFNNLTIKQEKEYIDDGLDSAAGFEDGESSNTDSETSSDTDDNDSESEREYRDLPSEDDECDPNVIASPLGLQISAVHSEFTCPQLDKKTESQLEKEHGSEHKTKFNSTSECRNLQFAESNQQVMDHITGQFGTKEDNNTKQTTEEANNTSTLIAKNLGICKEYLKLSKEIDGGTQSMHVSDSTVQPDERQNNLGGADESIIVGESNDHSPLSLKILSESKNTSELAFDQPSTSAASLSVARQQNQSYVTTKVVSKVSTHEKPIELSEQNDNLRDINRLNDNVQSSKTLGSLDDLSASGTLANEFDWSCNLESNYPSIATVAINPSSLKNDDITTSNIKPKLYRTQESESVTSCASKTQLQPFTLSPPLLLDDKERSELSNKLIAEVSISPTSRDVCDLSTFGTEKNSSNFPVADEVDVLPSVAELDDGNLSLHDKETKPVIFSVSAAETYTSSDDNSMQTRSDINKLTQEPYCTITPVHSAATGNDMRIGATNYGSSDINKLIENDSAKASGTIQNLSSKTTRYVDSRAIGDIEHIVSKTDKLIDHGSSPHMTQDEGVLVSDETVPTLVSFPMNILATKHSPIEQAPSTMTHIKDVTTSSLSLIGFQTNVANVNDMVPTSVAQHLTDLSMANRERITLLPQSSEQTTINCQLSTTPSRAASYSTGDPKSAVYRAPQDEQVMSPKESQSALKEIGQQITSIQPPALQCLAESTKILQSSHTLESQLVSSLPLPLDTSAVPNTNEISISIDLRNVLSNSTLKVPEVAISAESINEINSSSQIIREINQPTNHPTYHTDLHRFVSESSGYDDRSLNFTELCRSTSSLANLTEFEVELNTPTAGQLHTLIVPTVFHPPLISEISASSNSLAGDTDLRVPVLSEEVQNLLNEDTVATTNFAINESILGARCSTSTSRHSPSLLDAHTLSNFTDLENENEIAENNNNANIERELQDELGNVLAAAIADRSLNDEADDNNTMNENRANFDIT